MPCPRDCRKCDHADCLKYGHGVCIRPHEVVETDYGIECDKNLVGILREFNRIPGLRSYCSCEHSNVGHQVWIEFEATEDGLERLKARLAKCQLSWKLERRNLFFDHPVEFSAIEKALTE